MPMARAGKTRVDVADTVGVNRGINRSNRSKRRRDTPQLLLAYYFKALKHPDSRYHDRSETRSCYK